jgi:hypothetical protein
MRESYKELIKKANRIVVKVGTSSLTHPTGKLNIEMIEKNLPPAGKYSVFRQGSIACNVWCSWSRT